MKPRVLSLFDGSGCWQLAAEIVGFEAKYASEIEKFPIEVTKKNFPNMIHLGDVTKIKGDEIEPCVNNYCRFPLPGFKRGRSKSRTQRRTVRTIHGSD